MKKIITGSLLFMLIFAGICSENTESSEATNQNESNELMEITANSIAQDWERYPFETAIVDIVRITTNPQFEMEERIKLFIRKHGLEEARYIEEVQNIKMANIKQESSSHTIMTSEWLTTIKDGKATKVKNPGEDLMNSFSGKSQGEIDQFTEGIEDATGAETKNLGTKNIAGFECDLVEITSNIAGMITVMTQCNYQNLPLEIVGSAPGGTEYREIVTDLQINPSNMPTEPFEVPDGVPVQTISIGY